MTFINICCKRKDCNRLSVPNGEERCEMHFRDVLRKRKKASEKGNVDDGVEYSQPNADDVQKGLNIAREVVLDELKKTIGYPTNPSFFDVNTFARNVVKRLDVAEKKDSPQLREFIHSLEEAAKVLFSQREYSHEMAIRGLIVKAYQVEDLRREIDILYKEIHSLESKNKLLTDENVKLEKRWEMPHWQTLDGRQLLPMNMANEHITNAIRYYEKQYRDKLIELHTSNSPFEESQVPLPKKEPIYYALLNEARHRGLLLCKDKLNVTEIE